MHWAVFKIKSTQIKATDFSVAFIIHMLKKLFDIILLILGIIP